MPRTFSGNAANYFQCDSDFANIGSSPNDLLTMVVRAKITDDGATQTLASFDDANSTARYCRVDVDTTAETVKAIINQVGASGRTDTLTPSGDPSDGSWHVYALVQTTAKIHAVFDDESDAGNSDGTLQSQLDIFTVGASAETAGDGYDLPLNGSVDYCAVWNVDLSFAEITALSPAGGSVHPKLIRPSALQEFWRFQGTGNVVGEVQGTVLTENGTIPESTEFAPLTSPVPLHIVSGTAAPPVGGETWQWHKIEQGVYAENAAGLSGVLVE